MKKQSSRKRYISTGDIVDIHIRQLGKTSDINLFGETQGKFDSEQKFIGDKAYIGELTITIPDNKSRKKEIWELQKKENQQLSCRRIGVEHLIGKVKIFRVASDKFSLARQKYSQVLKVDRDNTNFSPLRVTTITQYK
ncbi:transposase family protein [Nostoc sp. PA-18-2419]|uniref:transposase family protein n=1 Tax=Nostoc sp. PA-18-2419 TaxID=2575443 RepID=UPI001108B001|nr:transposase family protein [Nostoc sp. PA-18-2419]